MAASLLPNGIVSRGDDAVPLGGNHEGIRHMPAVDDRRCRNECDKRQGKRKAPAGECPTGRRVENTFSINHSSPDSNSTCPRVNWPPSLPRNPARCAAHTTATATTAIAAPNLRSGATTKAATTAVTSKGHAEFAERHTPDPVAKMGRQHQYALDQRKSHAADHRRRDDPQHHAQRADGEQQGHEGGDGRQYAERDRDQDALRALDGAGELARAASMRDVDALADHHGIVHQQADRPG